MARLHQGVTDLSVELGVALDAYREYGDTVSTEAATLGLSAGIARCRRLNLAVTTPLQVAIQHSADWISAPRTLISRRGWPPVAD